MSAGRKSSGRGLRDLKVKVKTAKGRTPSQVKWLQRQLNDPYVKQAKADGYRGRAAYKLIELDDKFQFLKPGAHVVDLGCAPGGWSQVAAKRVNSDSSNPRKAQGRIIGIDLQEVEPIAGVSLFEIDFLAEGADTFIEKWLGGPADVVMSDMAAAASGHPKTDHLKIMALCDAAAALAHDVLRPGGVFVAKVLAGGAEADLLAALKLNFAKTAHFKPPASRQDSSEKFLVATGFRGKNGFSEPII